jgi:hypothetical protein
MTKRVLTVLTVLTVLAAPAFAQAPAQGGDARQAHYQIGVMERVLEGAVEHGAANFRDRLQAVFPDAPAQLMILDNPRVRGFRLDGYGVFFDVEVPASNGTLMWSLRTLDQALPAAAPSPSGGAAPVPASRVAPILPNSRRAGNAAPAADPQVAATALAPKPAQDDKILLENPNEAYRAEVISSVVDAMVDYSTPLAVGDGEWLTIAARGIQDHPRIAPADNDAQTVIVRVKGADLTAFRARQITRDDLMKRIEKRVF